MSNKELTHEQRYQISAKLKMDQNQTEISIVIGKNKSTICSRAGTKL